MKSIESLLNRIRGEFLEMPGVVPDPGTGLPSVADGRNHM